LTSTTVGAAARQDQDDQDNARAGELMRNAIQARGGDAYLNIKEMTSRGEYTPFQNVNRAAGLP
jgi:hypothetical protein